MKILILLFMFLPILGHAVEVLEVKGKIVKFRTTKYNIPMKKKILIYGSKKTKKGKLKKIAVARIVGLEGRIYSAKVIKKYSKEKIREGLRIRVSKKYRLKKGEKPATKTAKGKNKNASKALNFLVKTRPLFPVTGYFDAEAEFALKGSSKSFGAVFAYLSLETDSGLQTVDGIGFVGKYNRYFTPRAISQGFYMSGSFGLFVLTASGFAIDTTNVRSKVNVDLYVPYIGGSLGYQFIIKEKFSISLGAGAGYYLISSEIDTTSLTGTSSTMEIPLSGFTPVIDLAFGYSF